MKFPVTTVVALAVFLTQTSISTSLAQAPDEAGVVEYNVYCVIAEQDVGHATSLGQDCLDTKTWNEYIARQEQYFISTFNVMFLFYSGTHAMNRSLEVSNVTNLLFWGNSPNNVTLTTADDDDRVSTPVEFSNFSNINIEGLNIALCTSPTTDQSGNTGLLHFTSGSNVVLRNTKLHNTCYGSEIYAEVVTNISISTTSITKLSEANNICGAICLYRDVSGSIEIQNSSFEISRASYSAFRKFLFLNFGPNPLQNVSILIENCSFVCGQALGINLAASGFLALNAIYAKGCSLNSFAAFLISGANGHCSINNSIFEEFRSAVEINKVSIQVQNSVFQSNTASTSMGLITRPRASALGIYGGGDILENFVKNVTFHMNGYAHENYSEPNSAALLVYLASLEISGCQFTYNLGHALHVYQGHVTFRNDNNFTHNIGYKGAAMHLYEVINVQFTQSVVRLEHNRADYTGGAIEIAGAYESDPTCPFNQLLTLNLNEDVGLLFLNNSAGSAGDAIYGGYLDQAIVFEGNNVSRCIQIIRQYSTFLPPNSLSLISSEPSRVCLCVNEMEPNCLQVFSSLDAYPGEDITLSVVAVGQNFGTSAGFVNAQVLLQTRNVTNKHVGLGDHQRYQLVSQQMCNNLTYTVMSKPGKVILVLTATVGLIQDYGDNATVQESIKEYTKNNHSYVPKDLLKFPVYINITLKSCPPGFNLTGSPPECNCIHSLLGINGVKCHISRKQLERSGTVWIGYDNNSSNQNNSIPVLFSKYCPYNYCDSTEVNIFYSSDSQCLHNRTGKLCGKCPDGMSLTLGKSRCKNCSNTNLFLIAPFAVSGIVLVIFIKVTDLTIANGLINGLILYVNLVKANDYAFFTTTSNADYLNFLQVFVDWLNLDLGIETCFFDGMNGYWKTWLQFVFPIYIWAIALSMILLARYSMRMARLLGNNSVPVLATLFTLSYAKLFRTIITALTFTIVEDEQGEKSLAWSYDGTIDYLNLKHSLLFTVAVLVLLCLWLPYTCVLLFGQCLQRCNIHVISRLITRTKPFLDAHYGPFKDKHRYWFGMLLVARAVPLLIGVFTPISNEKITPLSTIAVVGALLVMNSQVYRKLYVSLSEALFLLNLLFLAASALYTSSLGAPEDQKWFTIILVSIAFTQFIVILVFSALRHFRYDVCATRLERIPLLITINTSELDEMSFRRD